MSCTKNQRGKMQRAGLLIVDVQVGFNPSQALIEGIGKAALRYATIVMTRFSNRPGSLYRTVLNWHGEGGALALHLPSAVILDKNGYGLTAAHLQKLKDMNCAEWHVCGLETDACVLACAFSLWDAGIHPVIQSALCESPLHSEGVAVARRQFG